MILLLNARLRWARLCLRDDAIEADGKETVGAVKKAAQLARPLTCPAGLWLSPEQQPPKSQHGSDSAEPEEEHPLDQLGLELRESLFELGIEQCEIPVVLLAELGLECRVHVVKQPHQLVDNFVSEPVVEFAGQLRGHRHVPTET